MSNRSQGLAATNRSNSDGSFLIRIRGLPFTTTKQEICDFFEGVNIINGEDGIHLAAFGLHSTKPLGEAYIELASEDDYEKAQDFHKKTMGARYIEVLATTFEYFQNIMSEQQHVHEGNVLRLRGIPWSATEQEIAEFFKGLELNPNNGIHIDYDKTGRVSGEAFVHFQTNDDCEKALNLNMQKLGHRYIEIFRSSEQQMNRSIQQTNQIFNANRMNRNSRNGNNRIRPYARNDNDNKMRRPFQNTGPRNNNGGFNGNNRNFNSGFNGNDQFMGNQNQFQQRFDDSNGGRNQFGGMDGGMGGGGGGGGGGGMGNDFNRFANDNFGGDNGFGRNGNMNGLTGDWNARFDGGQQSNNFNKGNNGGPMNDGSGSGDGCIKEKCCIHMRGLPYSTNEMDIMQFFAPLQPAFCKVIMKKNGLHSGEAKAYFNTFDETQVAMRKDGQRIGSRYIELFFAGNRGGPSNPRF